MPKRYRKSIVICSVAAALLLGAWLIIIRLPPSDDGGDADGYGHDHGVYLTLFGEAFDGVVILTPRDGESFTVGSTQNAHAQDLEAVRITCVYAANLPALTLLSESAGDLAQYGLDPPLMRVTVQGGEDRAVTFEIGGLNPDQTAYYTRVTAADRAYSQAQPGALYLIDAELGDQLTLPLTAYLDRRFWPGSPSEPSSLGNRPVLTGIEFRDDLNSYAVERVTPADDDAAIASYRMTAPFEFLCNGDAVREKVLAGILDVGLDEYVCEWPDRGLDDYGFPPMDRVLILSGLFNDTAWEAALTVGGPAPGGGRYVRFRDSVYIDRRGGYGFMDITPLDLTYGVPFWLYRLDDVARVEVVSGPETWRLDIDTDSYALTLPDGGVQEVKELNARRLFARLINFSISGNAGEHSGLDIQMSVTFHMVSGASHELRFYPTVNARLVPVGVDGAPPVLSCNIKDLQTVLQALALAGQGLAIPAEY